MDVMLDTESPVPLYRQIAEQVITRINDGRLSPRTRLPTVRRLSETLGISPLTVFNAYSFLREQGWIQSIVGRGTFVSPQAGAARLSADLWQQEGHAALIRDLHRVMESGDVRSLASGGPDPNLFPTQEFWSAMLEARRLGANVYEYGQPLGDAQLRNELAELMFEQGMSRPPDDFMITGGATRAMSLVTQAIAKPGDYVLVDEFTYVGFLCILRAHGVEPIAVPMDNDGPQMEAFEAAARKYKPAFYFTVPNFHNPTGILIPERRKLQIIEAAARHRMYVVEDDVFSQLAYDGAPPKPMVSFDEVGAVVHLGSFCKTIFPGARIGYILAPHQVYEPLEFLMRTIDLAPPTLMQRTMAIFLRESYKPHLRKVVPKYKERRNTLLASLSHNMPDGVDWTRPVGGFCVWLSVPPGCNLERLHQEALRHGVVYAPGALFTPDTKDRHHLRLTFGNTPKEAIPEAINILGGLIRNSLGRCED